MRPPLKKGYSNDFQTLPEALDPLLPYLKKEWVIWECAEGKGNLTHALSQKGFEVVGSDVNPARVASLNELEQHFEEKDFLTWQPQNWDCIITNPPFRYKQEFLERCYQLGKPFALLLPLTTFETEKRQKLFKRYGVEVIFLSKRINFETPSGRGSGSWFAVAWFTWGLGIEKELVFFSNKNEKTK
jgi:hypothetical protein